MKPFVPTATFGVHPLTSAQIQAKLRRHAYSCKYCREHPTSNTALLHLILDTYGHLFPQRDGELDPIVVETLSIIASAPSMMSVLRRSQEIRGTPGKNQKEE